MTYTALEIKQVYLRCMFHCTIDTWLVFYTYLLLCELGGTLSM